MQTIIGQRCCPEQTAALHARFPQSSLQALVVLVAEYKPSLEALQRCMPVMNRPHPLPGGKHSALTPLAFAPRYCSSCEPISVATSVLAVMMSVAPAVLSSAACRESSARAKMGVSLKCSLSVRTADTLQTPQRHPQDHVSCAVAGALHSQALRQRQRQLTERF